MTKPHRKVLVLRFYPDSDVPCEAVHYHQFDDGSLSGGDYRQLEPEVWRAQLAHHLDAFAKRLRIQFENYRDHVLLVEWPGKEKT